MPDGPAVSVLASYGWAELYCAQLGSGESYTKLKPTYAIWLLAQDLLPDPNRSLSAAG
ncbi:MAG: hypothetical protein VBE63_27630 [Lamprobacter sp.]|nr:hypothetical protein [Lamprobacter sp.]MEA3643670.1 hypothetical protein [Lamprobacter sp.]